MGSEKLTASEIEHLRIALAVHAPIEDTDLEDVIERLIDAYEATQRPIEPDEQPAGSVMGESLTERERKMFPNCMWCAVPVNEPLAAGCLKHNPKDVSGHTVVELLGTVATLRTQLAAAERERDEPTSGRDGGGNE